MRNRQTQHGQQEIHAFRLFVATVNLNVIFDSIEKRDPPEPDILCSLHDGSKLAFELVEICHPQDAAFLGRAPVLATLIEKSYQEMPGALKRRFDSKSAGKPLSFEFGPGATVAKIRARLPGILTELADHRSIADETRAFSADGRGVLVSVRLRGCVDTPGRPSFNIAGSFDPGDVVVESVLSKVRKVYQTTYPIELLAYFGSRAWGKSRDWVDPLQGILLSAGMGQFRRVWVLGWSGVEFSYPEGCSES